MKLEPLFTSKDNSLFSIDGTAVSTENCTPLSAKDLTASSPVPADNKCPLLVNISWEEIGLDDQSYNEELLANLRDYLKVLDEENRFAIIVPEAGKSGLTAAQKRQLYRQLQALRPPHKGLQKRYWLCNPGRSRCRNIHGRIKPKTRPLHLLQQERLGLGKFFYSKNLDKEVHAKEVQHACCKRKEVEH